jgi:methyl-accepting chemotaxis protein
VKRTKLLTRLLGGFVIVAVIVLAVGLVGLSGARRLNADVSEIGKNRLSEVKNLLQVAEAQALIDSVENSLMNTSLDAGNTSIAKAFDSLDASDQVIDASLKAYESLPKTKGEQDLWNELRPAMDVWLKAHQTFIALARPYFWGNSTHEAFTAMQNQLPQNYKAFTASNAILHDLVKANDQQADIAVKEGQATGRQVQLVSLAGMAAGVLLALFLGIVLALSIARPLVKGVNFATLVASGDFTQKLNIKRTDEVGLLANALNLMVEKLTSMVATIQQSAEDVASSSRQISSSAVSLSDGAQNQASALEQTSASMEELTASVDQVSEHAQSQAAAVGQGTKSMAQVNRSIEKVSKSLGEIAGLAGQSVEKAEEGATAVQHVVEGIELIAASSQRIGGIVTVISDIADQTNLLALNASIEAARAGEHGRGFAVVADEVSKLADRSSASTKEIEALIKESVRNVSKGVEMAQGSKGAMEQIRAASEKVKQMIAGLTESMSQQVVAVADFAKALENFNEISQSISAATVEQTTNAKQVSKAVESVNDLTQAAASSAQQLSGATEHLAIMAQELERIVGEFKIKKDVREVTNIPDVGHNGNKSQLSLGQKGRSPVPFYSEA